MPTPGAKARSALSTIQIRRIVQHVGTEPLPLQISYRHSVGSITKKKTIYVTLKI